MEVNREHLTEADVYLFAWVAALGDGWSNPDHLVFTTEFGRYINNKILYQNFKRIMRKLGKPDLRFHDLRHPYVKPTTKKFITFFEAFRAAI